jgi:penicillin-binding protein 2
VGCHGHPNADLRFSITTSCNAYYCHVFNELTKTNPSPRQAYKDWYLGAQRFGFGTKLGTDIPEAKAGLLPSPEYYDRMHGLGKWRGLTIISLGIGQGELKANALHIANLAAIIANRGYFISPHLGKALNGKPMPDTLFKHNYTRVDTAHFQIAWEGMYGAVHKPGGTAKIARLDSIAVYGKTGTAQNPHGKDHSVFMAFAPSKLPKIAIGVFVENGGFGATYAAPIASLIIEKYLTDTITRAGLEERLLKTRLE